MSTVVEAPQGAPGTLADDSEVRGRTRWPLDLLAAVVCVVLAVVAEHVLPSLPSYDPFSWLVWGRELAHHVAGGRESFVIHGGPSWKPLPVLFTTIFGLFGRSALSLWMIFCRAAGLYALYLAYVVTARIGASRRWAAAGPIAGVLAAVAVVLMLDWLHFMFRATSEPLTVTAALLWVDWHLRGRRMLALSAGTALALMRPESGAFLVLYALWCLWRGPGVWRRLLVAAELALIPAAWVLPPWLAEHKPFMSANQAKAFPDNRGHDLYTIALHRADFLFMWPVIAAVVAMALIALWRREWVAVGLAAICVAYVAIVEVMTIHGYPGLPRFLLPAGALGCVLAGCGVVRLAELVRPLVGGIGATVAACVLVAVAAPFCAARVTDYGLEHRQASQAVAGYDALVRAAREVGGVHGILPCRHSKVAVNHDVQPSLAWALGVPLDRVHPVTFHAESVRRPTLAFFAPRSPALGGSPRRLLPGLYEQPVARVAMWRVLRITRHSDALVDACVGGRTGGAGGGATGDGTGDAHAPAAGGGVRGAAATAAGRLGPARRAHARGGHAARAGDRRNGRSSVRRRSPAPGRSPARRRSPARGRSPARRRSPARGRSPSRHPGTRRRG